MEWEDKCIYDTRFIKLFFTLTITEDCMLPVNKASALRGGMGEMLLRANCIRDRQCEFCDFFEECIVQRTMYSKFKNKPESLNVGDSVGYVIECENYDEEFEAGSELRFNLILFGKTIVYFNQYMQAFFALGQSGLGKNKAHFIITSVKNTGGKDILHGSNIYMEYYKPKILRDYVKSRLKEFENGTAQNRMIFYTPVTIKHAGEFIKSFSVDAVMNALKRRLYILAAFEDADATENEAYYREETEWPSMLEQTSRPMSVRRYSSRKDEGMYLNGIKGEIKFDGMDEDILALALAGEITHIGKNTSFGFGKYVIK